MNCLKCGRELKEGQVFCDICMDAMEKEPIKINTPVMIPVQPKTTPSHRRSLVNAEEELKRLQKTNQNLILWLTVATIAAMLFAFGLYHQEFLEVVDNLGKNYHVIETVTDATTP